MPATPPLIDSHCHLDPREFDGDTAPVIARAREAGVAGFVVVGSGASLADCDVALGHAAREADAWAAIAVHPHDAKGLDDATFAAIAERARGARVVAIGETGLDYHYDHSPRELQAAAFRRFLALARELGKPLTLHIRGRGTSPRPANGNGAGDADEAHADARAIVASEGGRDVGGVVHCFTGGPDDARAWLDLGFHLSFSGIVTFKSADPIREAARLCPRDRMLVETDCPYLAPVPHRGQRNEPAYVVHTAARLAELRGEPLETLAAATTANARRLFRL